MRDSKEIFKLSSMAILIAGVFVTMSAHADDEEAAALMMPKSSVEVEAIGVSTSSAKFGEYNGLNKQGVYPNGNLEVRGGDAYKNNQQGGTTRWSVIGTDLGLSDRSASASISDQGSWNVGIGYDALTHNMSDTYQTPYNGTAGGNSWSLPSNKSYTNGNSIPTDSLQTLNISTTRVNSSFNASSIIDKNFSLSVDYNHLNQTGDKLGAVASSAYNASNVKGQGVSILPMPTNYQTDTLNLAANWKGDGAHLTASYFGSFFKDSYSSVGFSTWYASTAGQANSTQQLSTAPSNNFQQLNLNGGYDLASKTKLVGNFSYGINTQDAAFVQPLAGAGLGSMIQNAPASSLNGLVYTTHADLKITDQSVKDLSVSALYRYDERNNQTQSNMYNFAAVDGSNTGYYPNTPLSIRTGLLQLAGDYRITRDQKLNLTYGNESIQRWCNQYASGNSGLTTTSTAANSFPAGVQCVTATSSQSNSVNATYKIRANEEVDFKLGYGIDVRNTTNDQNAVAGFYSSTTGYTPAGKNGGNYYGYQPFFEASRNQQTAKGTINWRPAEDLSFGLTGKYAYAYYPNSTYGVQNSTIASLNLDGSYNYAPEASLVAYVTQQNGVRNLTNYSSSANGGLGTIGAWSNALNENDTTFGMGIRHGGLMAGKLSLAGDLTYSLGQTSYNTTGTAAACTYGSTSSSFSNCGSPGAIRNAMTQVKIGAAYQVDKNSKVGVRYIYQQLNSNDYYYNAYQSGFTPAGVMPTNQQSGSYIVNVLSASYTYTFD